MALVLTRETLFCQFASSWVALSTTNVLVEPSGQAWLTDCDLAPFRFGTTDGEDGLGPLCVS